MDYSQNQLHSLGVPLIGNDENVYIVRISYTAKKPLNDYLIMKNKLLSGNISEWDSDKENKIQSNDWLGFIIGETHNANVELFQVHEILDPSHRPEHWATEKYTNQITTENVKKRNVITFLPQTPIEYSWQEWKQKVNYSSIYMPRGTISAKHPF
tara:strand:+ start:160 stop:624 length:465 start_codon:yes stop_codon:yes gene_type:complete